MSSTARRKFFHFVLPTWSEFAWSLTASEGACNLRKGFATAHRYAVWNAFINWSRVSVRGDDERAEGIVDGGEEGVESAYVDDFHVFDHGI
jgi:hypothetical protein